MANYEESAVKQTNKHTTKQIKDVAKKIRLKQH